MCLLKVVDHRHTNPVGTCADESFAVSNECKEERQINKDEKTFSAERTYCGWYLRCELSSGAIVRPSLPVRMSPPGLGLSRKRSYCCSELQQQLHSRHSQVARLRLTCTLEPLQCLVLVRVIRQTLQLALAHMLPQRDVCARPHLNA